MRRLTYLELKRVIATRSTWVLLAGIILLSAVMAYFPVTYRKAYQVDNQGNVTQVEGKEAIECLKQAEEVIEGEVTEETLREAIQIFQDCYREYGAAFPPEVPIEVYTEKIVPVYPVLEMVSSVLTPDGTYLGTMTDADITPEDASYFYQQYREKMEAKGKDGAEQEKIRALNEDVETPFVYHSGFSSESFDYLALYMLLMLLVYVIITSPIFSAEYQTGADSILRCTRYGRVKLAVAKIVAAVVIFVVTFVIGTGIFLLMTNLIFGAEGLQTSVQMLNWVFVIPALTVGQTQTIMVIGGFLSLFATVSFTLFLSAKCRNVQDSLKIGLLMGLLPTIIYMISSKNPANLIRCILPSGGIGLMNSFLYEVLGTEFVHAGPAVVWTPYLMAGAALIEIPLFLILTVRAYCRRESV